MREQGIARPTAIRSRMKAELAAQLEAPALAGIRGRAWTVYERFSAWEAKDAE